jgi:16S rRNA (uracil1498-N3)-methyltransferase
MTRRRWIADEVSGYRAFLTGDHARHLAQVLRARVGQQFEISTRSRVHIGKITRIQSDRVEFELGDVVVAASAFPITAAISIFKFDRMEWAIEKCTELGVAVIVPLIAARTESHLASAAAKRVERWRRLANSASEQSRRMIPPEISDPIKLDQVLVLRADARVVLSEIEHKHKLKDSLTQNARSVVLAFGPEGGWKEEELASFRKAGWVSASLGSTIVRAETAVIAAIAVCAAMLITPWSSAEFTPFFRRPL